MHASDNLRTDRPKSAPGPAATITDPVPVAQNRLERSGYAAPSGFAASSGMACCG